MTTISSPTVLIQRATASGTNLIGYNATEDSAVARGVALRAAIAAALPYDSLLVGPGVFDSGDDTVVYLGWGALPANSRLIGSGVGVTILQTNYSTAGSAALRPGNNSEVSDMTIEQLTVDTALLFGNGTDDAGATNFRVQNVKLIGQTDAIQFGLASTGDFVGCRIDVTGDAVIVAQADCVIRFIACHIVGSNSALAFATRGLACNAGRIDWYGGTIDVATTSGAQNARCVEANGGTINVYDAVLTSSSSGGTALDLLRSSGTLNVFNTLADPAKRSGVMTIGDLLGVNTNSNAAAGNKGEVISAALAAASATSLTSDAAKTITSISLTAGDWDVEGVVNYIPAATTTTAYVQQGAHTTTNALGGEGTFSASSGGGLSGTVLGSLIVENIPTQRFSLAATTTVYLVAKANFAVSTMTAYGTIRARRSR